MDKEGHKDDELEQYYQDIILPAFNIAGRVVWDRHIKTNPDNFLHFFTVGDKRYVLAFDDYPNGFSIAHEPCVKSIKLASGEEILRIDNGDAPYKENVAGSFMLFQVLDADQLERVVDYLEVSYDELQKKWHSKSSQTVVIARDILQLAETASQNHDTSALYAIRSVLQGFSMLDVEDNTVAISLLDTYVSILIDAEFGYEFHTADDKENVKDEIYRSLSREIQHTIVRQKYYASTLGQTVRLVSAIYAKVEGTVTSGTTVAIVFEGEKITYPRDHMLNSMVDAYFAEHTDISRHNIEGRMPETLQDYQLVKGSIEVFDVFPRELEYISY